MSLELRPVTRENWKAVVALELADGQANFVASNLFSLAQAAYEQNLTPLAMYDGDTLVGFTMYTHEPWEGEFWILRVMLDKRFQNRGYGRQAMVQVIDRMRANPDCAAIYLDFDKMNDRARHLYESLGFVVIPERENEHEYVARLDLSATNNA